MVNSARSKKGSVLNSIIYLLLKQITMINKLLKINKNLSKKLLNNKLLRKKFISFAKITLQKR